MTEALQVQSELEQMVAFFKERQPTRILEIGVWMGGTLREWLSHCPPEATVVAVDLNHSNWRSYEKWKNDPATALWWVRGDSTSPKAIECVEVAAPYDWVFIDGDHSHVGVQADVTNYLPMIKSGGVLLLHDIAAPDGSEDLLYPPGHVFGQLANIYETTTFISDEPSDVSHGIGVVFV